jgi:hypothetical protein
MKFVVMQRFLIERSISDLKNIPTANISTPLSEEALVAIDILSLSYSFQLRSFSLHSARQLPLYFIPYSLEVEQFRCTTYWQMRSLPLPLFI